MFMTQIRHYLDAVQTCIFRQSRRNYFHGVGKSFPADRFRTCESARLRRKGLRNGNLRRSTTRDEGSLFHQATDDTESIVEGTFGFVKDQGVGAPADDRDG